MCYCGAATVIQDVIDYNTKKGVLQLYYRPFTGVLQRYYRGVTDVSQEWYKGVAGVLQKCQRGVKRGATWGSRGVTLILQNVTGLL